MFDDSDMKIAGSKPFENISIENALTDDTITKDQIDSAKELGKRIAKRFAEQSTNFSADSAQEDDTQMLAQRRLLLSFTVSVALDKYCKSDAVAGMAQKSFLDNIVRSVDDLNGDFTDTGAFSFYYLAYRRKNDVERRIGQTFAMLCSHDGDPIYQEIGEALYCWFSSVVRREAEKLNLA